MQSKGSCSWLVSIPLVGALAVGVSGCDSQAKASGAAGESASASSAKEKAAAPTLPKDGDATVIAELRKLTSCKREEGFRKGECAANEGWETFRSAYTEGDDLKQTKASALAQACFTLIADADDNVREASAYCLQEQHQALADKRSAILILVSRLEEEKSEGARVSMLAALDALDPVKNGGADELLALAKKLAPRDDTSGTVRDLMGALTPEQDAPNAETVRFAIELTKTKNASHQDTGATVLGHAKNQADEACKALLGLIETKKYPWNQGLRSMASLEGACKAHYDAVVTVVLAKLGEPEGYDQGFGSTDASYLGQLLDKPGFTADQKSKLLAPTEKRLAAETKENVKAALGELVSKLKK